MMTNHILEDKWRVQREMDEQAGHDPARYIALTHRKVEEVQERYGIRFRYTETESDSQEEPLPQAPVGSTKA